MSKEDFVKGMKLLSVSYGKEVNQEMLEVWYSMLHQYTTEQFSRAVQELIKTEKFFPSIAHITEQISKQSMEDFPEAEDEWEEVRRAVRLYGSYRIQEAMESFKPYTRKIVEHIGFWNICQATQEEQKWNRKEFIEEYNTLKDKYTTELQIGNKEVNLLNG